MVTYTFDGETTLLEFVSMDIADQDTILELASEYGLTLMSDGNGTYYYFLITWSEQGTVAGDAGGTTVYRNIFDYTDENGNDIIWEDNVVTWDGGFKVYVDVEEEYPINYELEEIFVNPGDSMVYYGFGIISDGTVDATTSAFKGTILFPEVTAQLIDLTIGTDGVFSMTDLAGVYNAEFLNAYLNGDTTSSPDVRFAMYMGDNSTFDPTTMGVDTSGNGFGTVLDMFLDIADEDTVTALAEEYVNMTAMERLIILSL